MPEEEEKLEFMEAELAGDKQMVETDFMFGNQAEQAIIRFSEVNNKLITTDGTGQNNNRSDEELYQSSFSTDQRMQAHNLLDDNSNETPLLAAGDQTTFDTHTVDNRFAEMNLGNDLIEEAK